MIHLVPHYRGARLVVATSLLLVLVPSAAFGSDDGTAPPAVVEVADPDCHTGDDNIECHQSAASKIVITEIMQNPSMVWDSLGEWFEIYNAGSKPVDLAGWTITDELDNHHVIAGSLVIGRGEYLILGSNSNAATNGGVDVGYSTGSDIFLFNSSDRLVLRNDRDREIDRVVWDNGATFPDPNGASMSLSNIDADNAIGSNWCTATTVFGDGDLGTPGRTNSCATAPPLQVTEIMQNPNAVSDVRGDWFEIHNPTGSAVDLAGWTIKDDDVDSHVFTGPLAVPAGGYVVVARSGDSTINGGFTADYTTGSEILLHNNFDELILLDPNGIRVDRVVWDDGRTFPDPTGASMSLRGLGLNNGIGGNWCKSTTPFGQGDLGTPGTANTCAEPTGSPAMARLEITEIMTNPSAVVDNDGEWFEIYNREATPVDIDGWTIRDFDTNVHVIDSSLVIPAYGYAVLGRNADQATNGGVAVDYSYGTDMVLYNAADEVVIVDPNGTIVDQVAYDDGRTFPDPDGSALALKSLALRNDVGDHWCAANTPYGDGDGGTPGAPNSCGPGVPLAPLVINEIMLNPASVPDSVGEWFEIFNPTSNTVDIDGWIIRDDDFNHHVIDNGGSLLIDPGGYLVLGRNSSVYSNGGVQLDYRYGTGMVLYNADDELILIDSNYVEVDRVEWDDGVTFPDPLGASMSLTDPALDNAVGSNWCISGSRYGPAEKGTPGAANECGPACDVDGLTVTVTATPNTLWPPNGRMHHVTTEVSVQDEEPGTVIRLVDVVSDEADPGKGKRHPDIVIIDDFNFELRAERNGWEDGRVYTITYEVAAPCGGTGLYSTTVTVVHDQGHGAY
ncbi:MAG: lamin tail domain-containing protein [bacterium]|nr:lamin tail domain-containing protein [bacterium]MCP4966587.1 lamin tail domain-containing protein [bacterium]